MPTTALIAFLTSVAVLVTLILITQKERRRGRRFFASGLRGRLDGVVDRMEEALLKSWNHFIRYIVQLNWYYSLHSLLRTWLRFLVAVYTYFEDMFERNRKRAKRLRAEKKRLKSNSHLEQIAQHKTATALTEAEKKRLKKRELEGRE